MLVSVKGRMVLPEGVPEGLIARALVDGVLPGLEDEIRYEFFEELTSNQRIVLGAIGGPVGTKCEATSIWCVLHPASFKEVKPSPMRGTSRWNHMLPIRASSTCFAVPGIPTSGIEREWFMGTLVREAQRQSISRLQKWFRSAGEFLFHAKHHAGASDKN